MHERHAGASTPREPHMMSIIRVCRSLFATLVTVAVFAVGSPLANAQPAPSDPQNPYDQDDDLSEEQVDAQDAPAEEPPPEAPPVEAPQPPPAQPPPMRAAPQQVQPAPNPPEQLQPAPNPPV